MAKKKENEFEPEVNGDAKVITLSGMYQDYFLDYASYVILERAVPTINDGLKPVQRRILHAMKEMDDGRFHKVANIIGQTMQYHPHGDAAIGDALVKLGQKELLVDCQGNWGDIRTGDGAAAPRYIEARLTKFALEILFNPQTTNWQLSYDGRKNEPITLPVKFPLLLAQGVEGIAVGLSTKVMPHNFIEIIKAAINHLRDKPFKLYPDFQNGGTVDVADYKKGKRGGKIRVRALIEEVNHKTIAVRELPYGVTSTSMIESIVKANDKGKIKIKKVVDNTAAEVEVLIELATGISPQVTIDALYAFTNCEVSISPNACVIINNKPVFTDINDLLMTCTDQTKELLKRELEIKEQELLEKWHFASLEKIFIENRIYRDIEECETWDAVIAAIRTGLNKYVVTPSANAKNTDKRLHLLRDITDEDIVRLTEIRIKRISKFNSFKADEKIALLEEELKEVRDHLSNLTDYAVAYFSNLLKKYGKGRERRTKIDSFEVVDKTSVVANNTKLYVNYKEGFVGDSLKKDTFICDCSDIDDVIVFLKDGKFKVVRLSSKTFVGKNIIHVDIWKKGDDRTTYNMIYLDGATGKSYAKRFNVTSITRDKEYDLTTNKPRSKVFHFSANPNGEAEIVSVQLSQGSTARKKQFDFDFSELAIKGRASRGNVITKYPVRKVNWLEAGKSTLGALKIWMDEVSGRLNTGSRGKPLGAFDTGDLILVLHKDGCYHVTDYELTQKFEVKDIWDICKIDADTVVSAIHYDSSKKITFVKRFQIETNTLMQKFLFIADHPRSKLLFATADHDVRITYNMKVGSKKMDGEINLDEFIDVKGWRALGNKLSEQRLTSIKMVEKPVTNKPSSGDSIKFDF
jgi:topoisomerase-4 subunit A